MRKTIYTITALVLSSSLAWSQSFLLLPYDDHNSYVALAYAIDRCEPIVIASASESWTSADWPGPHPPRIDGRPYFIHQVLPSETLCIYVRSTPDDFGLVCLLTNQERRQQLANLIREIQSPATYQAFPWAEFCSEAGRRPRSPLTP